MSLAISPDGSQVALGCGSLIVIYRIINGEFQISHQLMTNIDPSGGRIRYQKLRFSVDSKRLVSATQEFHNSNTHTVNMHVWTCAENDVYQVSQLDPLLLTVVSALLISLL